MEKTISNKQIMRYFAGICFAVYVIYLITNIINTTPSAIASINIIGVIVFALGIFFSRQLLCSAGSVLCIISNIISWILIFSQFAPKILPNMNIYLTVKPLLFSLLSWLIPFVALYWLFMLVASLNQKYAKPFYITASIILALKFIAISLAHSKFNSFGYVMYIFLFLAALLLAFSFEKESPAKKATNDLSEQLTKIENLKNLLDNGDITEDEFNTKKKQILNL